MSASIEDGSVVSMISASSQSQCENDIDLQLTTRDSKRRRRRKTNFLSIRGGVSSSSSSDSESYSDFVGKPEEPSLTSSDADDASSIDLDPKHFAENECVVELEDPSTTITNLNNPLSDPKTRKRIFDDDNDSTGECLSSSTPPNQNLSQNYLVKRRKSYERRLPSAAEISDRCCELFSDEKIQKFPCCSARIFAHVSLMIEGIFDETADIDVPPTLLYEIWSNQFMPLIRLFVDAEFEATSYEYDVEPHSEIKVHFSTYDCSSVWSPVDVCIGSNVNLERSIEALHKIFDHVDEICGMNARSPETEQSYIKKFLIGKIIYYLRILEGSSGVVIREELCKTMPPSVYWPQSRFCEAAKLYRLEFNYMLQQLSPLSSSHAVTGSPLRKRLGDLNCRAVRFYLRKLFNSIPHPYTAPSSEHEFPDLTKSRSNVHNIVQLNATKAMVTAAADGAISSVLAHAIRMVYDFFILNDIHVGETLNYSTSYINSFCNSPGSKRNFPVSDPVLILTDEEIDDIESDIREVNSTIIGARACEFIVNLMNWPGMTEAIEECGGWSKVEKYATNFTCLGIEKYYSEDAHISLLANVDCFLLILRKDHDAINKAAVAAHESSKELWKNFRCGARNQRLLRKNPIVGIIRDLLKEEKNIMFPDLIVPFDDESEDESGDGADNEE